MEKSEFVTGLIRQARTSRDIAQEIFSHFDEKTLRVIPSMELHRTQKIIIIGCGDSYCAAIAASAMFESVSKIQTIAMRCIDFSRNISPKELGYAPYTPLVIGISISGTVSRVTEALQMANQYGANTLAITDHPESPVGQAANHVLSVGLPTWGEYRPGANNYTGVLLALACLALRFARAKNTVSQNVYADMRKAIGDYIDAFEMVRAEIEDRAFAIAKQWTQLHSIDFIGDYADYATAFMNSAKCHEMFGGYTSCTNSEDWCHVNSFLHQPARIGRVVIANSTTPSFSRLKETITAIAALGSPCVVISDRPADEFPAGVEVLTTPAPRYAFLAPIMQHYPFVMIAGFLAGLKGFREILRLTLPEFSNPVAVDSNRIRASKIEII